MWRAEVHVLQGQVKALESRVANLEARLKGSAEPTGYDQEGKFQRQDQILKKRSLTRLRVHPSLSPKQR